MICLPWRNACRTTRLSATPTGTSGSTGGRARITHWDGWQFFNWEHALTISADLRNVLPNLAESWDLSEDGRVTTIRLRPGIKWSDGAPLTSNDFMFRLNHIWLDPEKSPQTNRSVRGAEFVVIDDLTFQYVFPEPNPLFANYIAFFGSHFVDPMHFFKQYHPAYRDREELNEVLKEKGFGTWMAMYDALRGWGNEDAPQVPTLRAYKVVRRTPTKMRLERNPYYFKIDPAGQQLPYIDEIDAAIQLENSQMITFQAATGQLDFAAFAMETQNIPLLKLGESKGLNKVHIWRRLHVADVAIQPNYNYPESKYRELVWGTGERRFVRALSHAIDRDQMNTAIYFGRGTPSQVTAHTSSRWYEKRFAQTHIRYDPDHARRLLDELGLHDVDGDGLREYPDGTRLTITLEFLDFETPKGISLELVRNYWREVGIDLRLKSIERGPPGRTRPGQQDADDGVACGQGHRHPVSALARLVLSPPLGLGYDHVEPLGTLLPDRGRTGRRAARGHPRHPVLGRRVADRHDRGASHEGRQGAAHRRGRQPMGDRHGGQRTPSGGGFRATQERDSDGHLGRGQPLDPRLPPGDLVPRRGA